MTKRTLATMGAAAFLAACGTTPAGSHAPPDDGSHVASSAWTLLGDTPAPRSGHTTVYEAARDRLLVFGGGANDLWAQRLSGPDAGAWERLDAGGDVPPPIGVVAVIDEGANRLMVFPSDSLDRAWSLPLDGKGAWSIAGFQGAPGIDLSYSLAVDPIRRRLYAYTSGSPEVWQLPLDGEGTWEKVAGPPLSGGFSCQDTLVYDDIHARLVVLSGGWPRGNVYALSLGDAPEWTQLNHDDAWFDYGAWTTYDAKAGRFLVAGPPGSGWVWSFSPGDATPAWSHVKVAGDSSGNRWGASGAYDSRHERFVMFGGSDSSGEALRADTWALSLGDAPAWSRLGKLDATMPPADGTSLAYAEGKGIVVRFGGMLSGDLGSTRVFDATSASWRGLGDAPGNPLAWSAGAWDPAGQRLVRFGGLDSTDENQTSALDLTTSHWTAVGGAGARPAARRQHSMVLDRNQGRMLVFGGAGTGGSYLDDVWALSMNADHWSKLDVAGKHPAARGQHAAAIDDTGRQMLVHGGTGDHGQLADTWMLELEPSLRWFRVEASGSAPPLLSQQFAAFDSATRQFILVGNEASPPPATFDGVSVWALSMEGTPRWHRYCPTGTRPASADGVVATDAGLFVTSKGSSWHFDPSTPTCD